MAGVSGQRVIYGLVVDCNAQSTDVHRLLDELVDFVHALGLAEVSDIYLTLDVPLAEDERRQDRTRTQAVMRLEDR